MGGFLNPSACWPLAKRFGGRGQILALAKRLKGTWGWLGAVAAEWSGAPRGAAVPTPSSSTGQQRPRYGNGNDQERATDGCPRLPNGSRAKTETGGRVNEGGSRGND